MGTDGAKGVPAGHPDTDEAMTGFRKGNPGRMNIGEGQ